MKRSNCIQRLLPVISYLVLSLAPARSYAQINPPDPTEPPPFVEQQLENLTEVNDDETTEDDAYMQELVQFIKDPVNLNYADDGQLKELKILSPIQISNLLLYRKLLGNFLSIYELQAVPGWDVDLIRRIRPYVAINSKADVFNSIGSRLQKGRNTFLMRAIRVLEKSRGYLLDNSTATNFYLGSPQRLLVRYKYSFKNLLQYGVTAEKDAGEQFFKGGQKAGFDYYSAHFFIRNLGIIKSLALGDFTVNLGQGLTQWGGLAFKKGADVLNIKRQSDVLRPYNSAGEINFNRGIGITLQKNNWEGTGFASYRKVDANFIQDTLNFEDFVSSLQTSGYHRTASEVSDKNSQGQLTLGGNLAYSTDRLHIGANAVHYNFEHTILKPPYLYNAYALSGKTAGNYSLDYSYTYKNMHFFGEAATDEGMDKAFINGILMSVDPHVDMSLLYRKISRGYQSLYTNAFTESTYPTNESGFYAGISMAPVSYLRINAYADFYHFPWLKFREDAPSSGSDYLIQLTYTPNKQVEIGTRYRSEKKAINYNPGGAVLNPVIAKPKRDVRTQFSYKLNAAFTFRSRVEVSWFDKKAKDAESGFLVYTDVLYKPAFKRFSGNIRIQYFKTDGYNSRLYAYESDVLYGYSIPVFYDKGYRYYLNFNYDLGKKLTVWGRFAQTIYPGKTEIGTGLDLIKGNAKSEITLQAIWTF
ncbi:helix-hairpin-helix domain-containing protein [Ginsengibacter hankyongi]|uniref:Helix-hairpin-helix domain-containing protein n=1 Tax=Ginsengibacter hankyongi TaxID=2607284 RepID=A0A5J5IKU6_9BACT|nr:helix-hairpin-helix domain-containing protein [Ginsengibacter hankyongi]KAA9041351.1 helix-hairpin-helix domain-containing protein [Ginsengibacter hankyongi]